VRESLDLPKYEKLMQGAQASCNGGGLDPPDISSHSHSQSINSSRPSFSLELYDRFAKDIQSSSSSLVPSSGNPYSPMDFESDDPVSGVPPPDGRRHHHCVIFFVFKYAMYYYAARPGNYG